MTQPITARHDLTIWRNDDYYEYPIRVVGVDLTGIVLAMDVRLAGDTPYAPLIALRTVTTQVQGVWFVGVSIVDGIEVSDVRIRMDRTSLQALSYNGEFGAAAQFEYALLFGGRTRLVGKLILPPHVYGSDNAPTDRDPNYGFARQASVPDAGATLTISKDGGATVAIDGADLVSKAIVRSESARDEAVSAAKDTVAAFDSLGQDAFTYVGRPADAALVNGTPTGIGSVFWHDTVDLAGKLTAVDVFDRAAGVINVAVYRGPLNALVRVGLGSFATTGTGTSRRIALAAPLAVRAGDLLAIQGAAGALTVAEVQSGDIGYTYSGPFLPENVSLDAPTTNGQVQVRFVITYREQIVTADNFLALSEIRVIGARARALSSAANPAGYVAWSTTGAPTGHTVTWGNYTAKLGPLADRMEFPQWSVSKPLFVVGNSLSDPTDVLGRWSQLLAARYGQHLVSVARYSSDQHMVYRSGAAPISLTLAGALPAGGSVAVTQINGAPIDGNNPAAFLTTGDAAVVTGMSMVGYVSRNGVERKVTVSAPNGASYAYSVTQAPGQTAMTFDGPVLFTPEASLSIRGSTCIVWMGNNYFYSEVPNQYGDYTNPQMWVDLKLIVSFLQSQGCQVLLLPVIPASLPEWVEGVGTPLTASRAANARTEEMFPGLMAHHADGRGFIKFLQDRKDGSPDAQADVDKGWIPRNLHRAGDPLHLNEAQGDVAVADFVDSALRSQVGPPAITQATTFTITAQGPQAGLEATTSVRVARDQLASLADAIDGVVQDAVYRPTIAAAITDFDVGTFFVSRDLDGLTAHTGVKWQYKVTADFPHFSDEGAWSDTNAAALGLDAYVGTTPNRLPVSSDTAVAIAGAKSEALASTSALGLMTGNALDLRVRVDAPQALAADAKAQARSNMGALDADALGDPARGASLVVLGRGSRVEDALNETISLMEFRTAAQKSAGLLPDTDAWDRASQYFRDTGKTGTLLLPPGVLLISRTVSFPVGVSLRGAGRRTVIQPTEDGVYINAFVIRLNSTGSAWEQQYPNTSSGRVSDLRMTNTTSQNLRAIQFGGSYIFNEVRFSGFGQGISMVGIYCDFVDLDRIFFEADRAADPAWGASGDHLINLGLGDAWRVNALHISGPSSIDRKVLRSFGCRGGLIQGIINGVITLQQCVSLTVIGAHFEFGGIDITDGNAKITDCAFFNMKGNSRVPIRLFSSNGVYGELYSVKLDNNSFASTPDAAGYPVGLVADVQVNPYYRVEVVDQARYVSKWNDISKHRRHGIVVANSDGTLNEAFNGVSALASRSSTILNQRVIFERPMTTGQLTVHTGINSPITLDGFASWPLATGTYFYQMQMVVDRTRFIAGTSQFGVNERSVGLTNGAGVPQLNINDGSAAMPTMGWSARLYRGTATGVYSQYVDVPMTDGSGLLDTGSHLNGFPWIDQTPGPIVTTNGLFGQVRYSGRNVVATITTQSATYVPTLGTWTAGDRIILQPEPVGTDGRVLNGYVRLTTGSGHVIGTDWLRVYGTPAGRLPGRTITAATTLASTDLNGIIDCTAGANGFTVTLPDAGMVQGDTMRVRKIDTAAGAITVAGRTATTQWQTMTFRYSSTRSAWEPVL